MGRGAGTNTSMLRRKGVNGGAYVQNNYVCGVCAYVRRASLCVRKYVKAGLVRSRVL